MRTVERFPEAEPDVFEKPFQNGVFQNNKLLICGGFQIKTVSAGTENFDQAFGHCNRVSAKLFIQSICEKCVELHAKKPAFCQKCAAPLDRKSVV